MRNEWSGWWERKFLGMEGKGCGVGVWEGEDEIVRIEEREGEIG